MSKVIAIIDMPDDCFECPLLERTFCLNKRCNLSKKLMDSIDLTKRPDWCPLKELPEKYDLNEEFTYENMWDADEKWAFENGYNTCLKEILGE